MKTRVGRILIHIGAIAFVIYLLLPVYSAVIAALTPESKLGAQLMIPVYFHWKNFVDMWKVIPLGRQLTNSFIYSIGVSCIILAVATPAAYALSRFKFSGRQVFLFGVMVTQMIPLIILLVPVFVMAAKLNAINTYAAVFVTAAATGLPFPILLLKGYFDTISSSLDEAAMVDGCTRLQAIIRILLPLAVPGLVSAFMTTFILGWAQFIIPLILITDTSKMPVTVGIYRLLGETTIQWNLVMAATLLSVVPPMLVYLVAQRRVAAGLVMGAIKE
ncbi:MAG: carbohydrate ABC transporter permease [Firmicutes bacterium]|nr:carbohydrate ABC transporter permease [Bacillota bacterium]